MGAYINALHAWTSRIFSLKPKSIEAMVEIIEAAGSPDSGYMSHSPLANTLDGGGAANDGLKVRGSAKSDANPAGRAKVAECNDFDPIRAGDSEPREVDGKSTTCSSDQFHTAYGDSLVAVGDKLLNTQRRPVRKRRVGNRPQNEDETSSPVLGIKILPMGSVQPVHLNTISAANEKNEEVPSTKSDKEAKSTGKFVCRLCAKDHSNALELAQHQCPRIVNVRYECSECGKSFGCPANLASHKRWHKPKERENASTMVNPESKRSKLSASPTEELCKALSTPTGAAAASPSSLGSEEDRSTPSPKMRMKAIYPCPVCKRRFRRESNQRKHVLVKHDINMPSLKKPAKPAAPAVKCSLATLALAAESVNKSSNSDSTQRTAAKNTSAASGTQPLDLTTKPSAATAPAAQLRHGVEQILNLSQGKHFGSSPFPTINDAVSAGIKHALLQGHNALLARGLQQPAHVLPHAHAFQQWPITAQPLFADYRYLAAMAAERMLTCAYRR